MFQWIHELPTYSVVCEVCLEHIFFLLHRLSRLTRAMPWQDNDFPQETRWLSSHPLQADDFRTADI